MLPFDKFQAEYEEYAFDCACALRIAEARLINIQEALVHYGKTRSQFRIESRIKTLESAWKKYQRKISKYGDTDDIQKYLHDVAGIRIITVFRDEIKTVAQLLESVSGISVTDKKDYVAEPKSNGYSSYHLDTMVEIFPMRTKIVPVEIQIRDKAMNLWASHEHILKYKNDNPDSRTQELFKKMADALNVYSNLVIEYRDQAHAPEEANTEADQGGSSSVLT